MNKQLMPALMLLTACAREPIAPPTATRVVATHDTLDLVEELEFSRIRTRALPLVEGCDARADGNSVILQCTGHRLLVRFDCRDHTGRAHPLSVALGLDSYRFHCE